jgi:hypothetical protein
MPVAYEEIKTIRHCFSAWHVAGVIQGGRRLPEIVVSCLCCSSDAEEHNIKRRAPLSRSKMACLMLAELGGTYVLMEKLDSALFYTQKSMP